MVGFTDILGNGHIDLDTDGDVTLTEFAGDMRVGLIVSEFEDVILTSPASIVDAALASNGSPPFPGDSAADVTGRDITMTAGAGIGADNNFLEIDSSFREDGVLTALAVSVIRIEERKHTGETTGDLHVNSVVSLLSSVTLATTGGSILDRNPLTTTDRDGRTVDTPNVQAISIDLDANGGSIGESDDDFDIDSRTTFFGPILNRAVAGRVYLEATGDIYLTESNRELNLLAADSSGGLVRLTVPDTSLLPTLPAGDPNATTLAAEDLFLLHSGTKLIKENLPTLVPKGRIAAATSVTLWVGDNVATTDNSEIVAGTTITIRGDERRDASDLPELVNADPNFGPNMDLRGIIGSSATTLTQILGHLDVDLITFNQTFLGAKTRVYGSQNVVLAKDAGGKDVPDGEDLFTVNQLPTMDVAGGDTLTLDGQAESDTYLVNTTGSRGADRNYVINVLDTGTPDDGVDMLSVYGADSTQNGIDPNDPNGLPFPTDDIFLLRGMTSIPNEAPVEPAFVAVLHATLAQARPTGVGVVQAGSFPVERINYDRAINGRLLVFGLGGNDYFATDDTSVITTLDGGKGDDTFPIASR